jgi:hypothetical protein
MIYPHRHGATIIGYKNVVAWLDKFTEIEEMPEMKESFPINAEIVSILVADYSAKVEAEKVCEQARIMSLRHSYSMLGQGKVNNACGYFVIFHARLQCFTLAARPFLV